MSLTPAANEPPDTSKQKKERNPLQRFIADLVDHTDPRLSMRQASLKAGLNRSAIYQIVNNDSSTPKPKTLKALADVIGTPKDYLEMMSLAGHVVPEQTEGNELKHLSPAKRRIMTLLADDNISDDVANTVATLLKQFIES